MTWLSSLFTTKTVDNVLDKNDGLLAQAGEFIGNLHYTEEEKAEASAKLAANATEYFRLTLGESTVRSRTRRFVAVSWISVQLFLILSTCAAALFGIELAKFLWSVATSNVMWSGTGGIIVFFFGAHAVNSVRQPRK